MSYLVLARKWRPQRFADILGQEHVTRTLQNAIRAGRVAHAFLFTGVRGVGKTTAARVLAKALNCAEGPAPEPCNACENCEEIASGRSLDVVEIDGASNTGVDDVRAIIDNVRYQPVKCRYKIYIIDEVHMLSTSAFNALLKTLEEPPAHVKFIFATTDPHKVPATIQSRCQRYEFKRLPLRLVTRQLAEIAAKEGLEITEKGLFLLARESEGSMRDAQSLLDQVLAFAGPKVEDEQILHALGIVDRSVIGELADALLARDAGRVLQLVERVYESGQDLRRFTRDVVEHFRNLAVVHAGAEDLLTEDLPEEEVQLVRQQAQATSFLDCERMFRTLLQAEAELGRSPLPKCTLEMHLLRLTMTEPLVSLATLAEQLQQLRKQGVAREAEPGESGKSARGMADAAAQGGKSVPRARMVPTRSENESVVNATQRTRGADGSAGGTAWQGFLEFVANRHHFAAAHLETCVGADWEGDVLRVRVPAGIHYQYLTQKGRSEELAKLASEFFGRPVRVEVNAVKLEKASPPGGDKGEEQPAADTRKAILDHPAVRQTMEILGAELREVRERFTK